MNVPLTQKTKLIIFACVVLILTFIFLSPCLQNNYCNWDDYHLITANHSIKDLSLNNIKEIFTTGYVGTYIPLTVLSFALEYKLSGLNPVISHTINLIFHLFNVLLVFWLIYLLSNNLMVSVIVSLLFGIHPMHVESVAWATERKDMLYSFFYLGSLIFYLYHRAKHKVIFYFGSIILFILSLLSKPMAITLPIVLILFDFYFEKRFSSKQILPKLPYIIPAIFLGIVNIHFQGSVRVPFVSYFKHIFVFCYNLIFYLYKIILPVNLSAFYPYPKNFEKTMPLIFFISPLIIAGLVYLIIKIQKVSLKIIFGFLFFIITILPVSQLIPLVTPAIAADRYTYIPSIGLFFIAGIFIDWLYNKNLKDSITMKFIFYSILALVFLIFGIISFNRCKIWKDSITLWTDVLKKFPDSEIAFNNRGNAYKFIGAYEKAIGDFNKAIEINPELELPYFNRGTVYEHLGEYNKAIADFTTALNIQPDFAMGYVDRGAIYCRVGEYDKAYNDLTRALQLRPDLAEAYYNLGVLYFNLKNYKLALEHYDKALGIDPYLSVAYVSKGDIYFIFSDFGKAIEYYTKAIDIDPKNLDAYYNRAVTFTRVGDLEQALSDYNSVLGLNPKFAQAYNNRGNIYLDFDKVDMAIRDYDRAIELDSSYIAAYYNRAVAYYIMGNFDMAKKDVEILKKFGIMPDSSLLKALKIK